jgi:3-oxoacyl-[acyl-carrier-protein] synthase-3
MKPNARLVQLHKMRISATGSYVPAKVITNATIVDGIPTTASWIEENLGIRERRIAEPDEFTSDLAARAGIAAIENAGLDRNDIDMIMVATATPDRKVPSTACIVQGKMGITNTCPAFDVAAVCSGFLYGLTIAGTFVENGACDRVLVIGADTFSKITDWHHRNCVFFGDGAGAVVVERNAEGNGLFSSLLFADGTGVDGFTVHPNENTFRMNTKAVYDAATTVLPQAIQQILALHGLEPQQLSMIIPHQPSIRVLRRTAEVLNVPFSMIQSNVSSYANTAGATVPLLLDQINAKGLLRPNDLIVFAAVGAGWTWSAALYRWEQAKDFPVA